VRRIALAFILMAAALSVPALAAENIHLSIDASRPGPKIDRNIFGQFAENLGHGLYEGMPQ
jgi:alpha-L-arabinofuranosidase